MEVSEKQTLTEFWFSGAFALQNLRPSSHFSEDLAFSFECIAEKCVASEKHLLWIRFINNRTRLYREYYLP